MKITDPHDPPTPGPPPIIGWHYISYGWSRETFLKTRPLQTDTIIVIRNSSAGTLTTWNHINCVFFFFFAINFRNYNIIIYDRTKRQKPFTREIPNWSVASRTGGVRNTSEQSGPPGKLPNYRGKPIVAPVYIHNMYLYIYMYTGWYSKVTRCCIRRASRKRDNRRFSKIYFWVFFFYRNCKYDIITLSLWKN